MGKQVSSSTILLFMTFSTLAGAVHAGTYTGSAVVVTRAGGTTAVDNGVVTCEPFSGDGKGGSCIPFSGSYDSISVVDVSLGTGIAFGVCIDNNQDRNCGGQRATDPCQDQQFFSHRDDGGFDNPLGSLPTSLASGCPPTPGGFNGYIIFICSGAHDAPTAHIHDANSGTVSGTTGGTGMPQTANNRFCWPPPDTSVVSHGVKSYVIEPPPGGSAGYTGSAVVVTRADGRTIVDNGVVTCNTSTNSGKGGSCIPFDASYDSLSVVDSVLGTSIAFSVCIDNNQDRNCGGQAVSEPCQDELFLSHRDDGGFDNQLGALPPSLADGCHPQADAFNGYIIFICSGAHDAPTPHTHEANYGIIQGVTGGTGMPQNSDNRFCYPPPPTGGVINRGMKRYEFENPENPGIPGPSCPPSSSPFSRCETIFELGP